MREDLILRPIVFRDIAVNENDGWFCDIYYDALFHMDLCTGKIQLCGFLRTNKKETYSPIAYHKGKLIIAPRNADNILIYDIEKMCAKKIKINTSKKYIGDGLFNFFSAIDFDDSFAYLFPGRYRSILRINLENYEIKYIDEWYSQIECLLSPEEKANKVIFSDLVEKVGGNKFVLVCWQTNLIMIFDADTGKCQFRRVGIEDKALASIVYEDGLKMVSYRDENFLTIPSEGRKIELNDCNTKGGVSIFDANEKWFVVSNLGGRVITIDKDTEAKEIILDFAENREDIQEPPYYIACRKKVKDRYLVCSVIVDGKAAMIDTFTREIALFNMKLSEADERRITNYRQSLWLKGKKFFETERFSLENMIGCLKYDKMIEAVDMDVQPCGKLIFSEIMKSDLQ